MSDGLKRKMNRCSVFRCANCDGGHGCAFDGPGSFGPGFRSSERAAAMYGTSARTCCPTSDA